MTVLAMLAGTGWTGDMARRAASRADAMRMDGQGR